MGMNATIHAKDDAVQDSLGRDTWQPVKSTNGALHVTGSINDSDDNPLPSDFSAWEEEIDETDPNDIVITKSKGAVEYVQHITVVGAVTTISQWVLQP